MRNRPLCAALLIAPLLTLAPWGCAELIGFDEYQLGKGTTCKPRSVRLCDLALPGAQDSGACQSGFQTCNAEGTAYGDCVAEIASGTEECSGTDGGGGLGFDAGPPCGCSSDLKSVVDCNGGVVITCNADQGCANSQCIDDPCQAAEIAKSTTGCDYWALKTVQRPQAEGACFTVFIVNTWSKPVHFEVKRDGQTLPIANFARIPEGQGGGITYAPYNAATGLGVGEVATVFLSRRVGGLAICPVDPAIDQETGVSGTGIGDAFHITSDYPVVVYQVAAYGSGQNGYASATLLLPTSAWDTNYLAVNAYGTDPALPDGLPSLNIVAREDATDVMILPKVDIAPGMLVRGAMAGVPVTYTLNAGEFLQITQTEELTGSPIQSTKPVGVFGASACMQVPSGVFDCDSAHQQIPPVRALGSEYAAVRHRGRMGGIDEAPPWRLVGAVTGTQLTWKPSTPPGAPTALDLGEVAEFTAAGPFVVRSQGGDYPFYLGGYMTGGVPFNNEGDPEWVNVIPPSQYLNRYVIFTDPTYPETSLVVVRTPSMVDGSFAPVTLGCAGELTGWQPFGEYEYTRVDLVTGNFQNVGNCSNGRQEMSSTVPFGVTVWGWGVSIQYQNVSYAYPAGASFQSINEVVVPTIPR